MSSKFKVSIFDSLKWPEKCVVCGGIADTSCTAGGVVDNVIDPKTKVKKQHFFSISYPICLKHKYTTIMIRILYHVSLWGTIGLMFFLAYGFAYGVDTRFLYYLLLLLLTFIIALIASIKLQPVRAKFVGHASVTILIRNDQYAWEFSTLNSYEVVNIPFGGQSID